MSRQGSTTSDHDNLLAYYVGYNIYKFYLFKTERRLLWQIFASNLMKLGPVETKHLKFVFGIRG